MKFPIPLPVLGALCVLQFSQTTMAAPLDPMAENVTKQEISYSMIGKRDTLRFYIFGDRKAVLRIVIGNENTEFPITAKLYEFAGETTAEALDKWVNNQHSDAIFIDAAEPSKVHDIPAGLSKVTAKKAGEQTKEPNGDFTRYDITFEFKGIPAFGDLQIKDFSDKAVVFVKTEAG